ncbi:MAG: ferrous iron transport protein B [Sphaerochaetaceae bacterium]|nr:ferrous iron transport protein B [Sphaerochaetaceae bacterium]
MKIVLAGNPNSGKTTLFNILTGTNQHVGNWPGVTVEKKEGKLKGHKDVTVIDLPGIYSLSPYSLEEVISRNYLLEEKPDVIINIIDGTNLERNLYLTTQLSETGVPMILAINMMDQVEKNEDKIKTEALGKYFNSEVVEIVALKNKGIDNLVSKALEVSKRDFTYKPTEWFSQDIEEVLSNISSLIKGHVDENLLRWYSIKLFENDEETVKQIILPLGVNEKVRKVVNQFIDNNGDDDNESLITKKRYEHINRICNKTYLRNKIRKEKMSNKIDRIITNKWLALPIFAVIIFLVYYISITTVGGLLTDLVNDGLFGEGGIPDIVGGWLSFAPDWLSGIIVDGIIGGVGAVLGFLPQMFVLFILLGILEESGYMARIAFILDRIFRKFGLSGKSFIPMLISTGCAIPGVMASRTIEDERDRKMTIMTTTFMPCGAKLPIIALIAGALFNNSGIIATSAYFIAIAVVIISGIILKKFKAFAGEPAPFIMELPDYHLPRVKSLGFHVWNKLKSFIVKAGTIILISSIVIWFFSSFSWSFQMVDNVEESILSSIGRGISWIFTPLGWADWKATVATITGLVAKENVVGTFGVLYGFAEVAEDGGEIWSVLANDFTALTAYSFLVFNLICAPCFAAIGAIRREMGSAKWTWIAIGFQTAMAYVLALIIYQIGRIFIDGFAFGSIIGLLALAGLVYLLFRKNPYKD